MSEPASTAVRSALRGQTMTEGVAEHPLDRIRVAQQEAKQSSQKNQSSSQPDSQTVGQSADQQASEKAAQRVAANLPEDLQLERSKVAPGLYKPVPEIMVFQWSAPSRPFKKHQRQFFVTVTVIALLVSLILFFSGQFLPIAVVISVLFLMYVLQVVPPQDIQHQLTTFGIKLEDNLYYWQEMGRFWFDKKFDQLLLNIETLRFPGRITMVLPKEHQEEVREILAEVLLEQKPELTTFEKISQWFQEKIPLE
ncbi:MAG: hypothetical protein A2383_01490 [Candidatus Pacebacteria bacterium RIFOXYB1_FULL_39_46]|nr:MAG: hypothetical protein A2383_01490 [Candidatus Pacebacteria bacterium RIFOXYB1_FULL_39_46]OGJ39063.1 MAG: hypothetical protein A2182_01910 [Candidatus Pacebacteria bacterium RIFOXYA1_FULL_38_18]OGJ39592.1 MAG: hypothetical protein A2582_01850 [Candidatus Pacebacteria bacterium RIFOXYD1_FULL_39_27]OGJ40704.1 MAG: hypothetical protein A2411_00260 [Candidatus Pacebacteria bacterium RIFOXYC1_FULL_39_21]